VIAASAAPLRALIVEDHPMVGDMLSMQLTSVGMAVVAVVATEDAGVTSYRRELPELVLSDVRLGAGNGLDLVRKILVVDPGARVIMVSGTNDGPLVQQALDAGAAGFVSKQAGTVEFLSCIADVLSGLRGVHDRGTYRELVQTLRRTAQVETLTSREREILEVMAAGTLRSRDIAEKLFISELTVKTHVQHVLTKLGVTSRGAAVAKAHRDGLLTERTGHGSGTAPGQ
jgi:two-component system nitrate/nitrite response regulator NarL